MWERVLGFWEQLPSLVEGGPEVVLAIVLALVLFVRYDNVESDFFARTYLVIALPTIIAVGLFGRDLHAAGGGLFVLFLVLLAAGVMVPVFVARGVELLVGLLARGFQ